MRDNEILLILNDKDILSIDPGLDPELPDSGLSKSEFFPILIFPSSES
jgi:hypothetical protein